ncbi:MAG: hypothetical protein ACRCYQ_11770 [Nocardioides sp.]
MTTVMRAAATAAILIALAACGDTDTADRATDADGTADGAADGAGPSATADGGPPALPQGPVVGFGTVIDDAKGPGDGAELCLGAVAESAPPRCEGIPLEGWTWKGRGFDEIDGVRFGAYAVTGTYDGSTIKVTGEPISGALYDTAPDESFRTLQGTRCPEPKDGWQVVNRLKATARALDQVEGAAAGLDGYTRHWVDRFTPVSATADEEGNPDSEPGVGGEDPAPGTNRGGGLTTPLTVVLNVQVTGDVEVAAKRLRTQWGGALCVTNPERDEDELARIARELAAQQGIDEAAPVNGMVSVKVLYDDGSLQERLDERYGPGTVVVLSSLHDVA